VKRINVHGPLTEDAAERIVVEMRGAAGRPIDLRIDSEGGKFAAAIHILLEAEEHPHAVFTTVIGYAGSAAGIVAIAGDVRRIDRRGQVMLHYPSPASRDGALKAREIAHAYTGQPMEEIAAWHAREKFFGAAEAVHFGLADRIVDATAPEPVRLRDPLKRRPAEWLREYRELFERLDLRADDTLAVDRG
jgi:ATP-dependent protease ClpP protease subunit